MFPEGIFISVVAEGYRRMFPDRHFQIADTWGALALCEEMNNETKAASDRNKRLRKTRFVPAGVYFGEARVKT